MVTETREAAQSMIDQMLQRAACACAMVLVGTSTHAVAQYEAPAGYYAGASGVGPTLKASLHTIVSSNFWMPGSTSHIARSYDAARQALHVIDRDQSDPAKIILFYTGNSVSGAWDAGATWNREHTWPVSLQGGGSSGPDYSDLHMLRPCNPSVNSSRGNKPFGTGASYWDPLAVAAIQGVNHRGDSARGMFYMDARYDGGDASTVDLTIVNGLPFSGQMGDLERMLEWHYTDPVDEYERRRNHLIFSNTANPSYYQGNRNPFVDRPEFVWAIWGPTANEATVFVGAAPQADGSSSDVVTLRALVGAPAPQQSLTVHKSGDTPTTYDLVASGPFTIDAYPRGLAFPSGVQQAAFILSADSTATPGLVLGQLTIDNTDLTSAGAGQGSADADDTVTVMIDVLTHAVASFDGGSLLASTTLYAEADQFGPAIVINVPVHNLGGGPAQAMLDVDSVAGFGGPFSAVEPYPVSIGGSPAMLTVQFDPTGLAPGVYNGLATVGVSDEDLPGASTGALTLALEVTVVAPCFGDANDDDIVDFDDIAAVLGNWLTNYTPGTGEGDANGDGLVDFDDITEVLANWLNVCN